MHLPLRLLLLLSICYEVLSMPTTHHNQHKSKSFRVKRVRRGNAMAEGPNALRKVYRKYGITPSSLNGTDPADFELYDKHFLSTLSGYQHSQDPGQKGTTTATSVHHNVEFVSPVTIGGQNITLTFDSGSSDMWVMNTQMKTSTTHGHVLYNPERSRTYQQIENSRFSIRYGDSSWAYGKLASDTVSVGGATFPNQVFGLPMNVAGTFAADTSTNGLVGLAFSSINSFVPGPQKTFFDNIAPTLDEPVFTSHLQSDGVGEYEFGTIDQSKYTGQLVNISIDNANGFWQFDTPAYGVKSGDQYKMWKSARASAIADTGTSLLMANADVVQKYYQQVPGAFESSQVNSFVYPCKAEMPDLFFVMEGYKFVVPGKFMNFGVLGRNVTSNEEFCVGGLQWNQGMNFQIFGDVFLKAFFVVFDQRGPSLGIAAPA